MTISTIDINRPPDEVFTYVTDPSRFGEWQHGVVSGHMDGDRPGEPGAKCVTVRRIGLAQRPVTAEVTRVDAPRTSSVHGIDGPIRATVNVTVDPLETGRRSRVSIDIAFTGYGVGKLLVPLIVRPQADREMHQNLQRLKDRLESPTTTGPKGSV